MKKFAFFFTLLFIEFSVIAQVDFREGYIIKNNNDTIYGLIDYRNDKRNSKKCIFKPNNNSDKVIYLPSEIIAYRYKDNKMYISRTIIKNNDITSVENVFLEYLVKGTMSLYYYRDANGIDHYYVEKADTGLQELIEEEKEEYKNGLLVAVVNKKYLNTLDVMTYSCESLRTMVENAELTHSSLIKITKKYNECVCSDCEIFVKPKSWIYVNKEIFIGFNSSQIAISSLPNTNDNPNWSDNSFNLSFGSQFNFILPRINEKLSFAIGVFYAKHYYELNTISTNNKLQTDWNLFSYFIKTPVLLRYTYPKGKLNPYVSIGTNMFFVVRENGMTVQYSNYKNEIEIFKYEGLTHSKPFFLNYTAEIGLKYNIYKKHFLMLEFRAEYGFVKNYSILTGITF